MQYFANSTADYNHVIISSSFIQFFCPCSQFARSSISKGWRFNLYLYFFPATANFPIYCVPSGDCLHRKKALKCMYVRLSAFFFHHPRIRKPLIKLCISFEWRFCINFGFFTFHDHTKKSYKNFKFENITSSGIDQCFFLCLCVYMAF